MDRYVTHSVMHGAQSRSLYDFTVSAPKSVSVQALIDPRLREAHQQALAKLKPAKMEWLAGARSRIDGADTNQVNGNLVIAAYHQPGTLSATAFSPRRGQPYLRWPRNALEGAAGH